MSNIAEESLRGNSTQSTPDATRDIIEEDKSTLSEKPPEKETPKEDIREKETLDDQTKINYEPVDLGNDFVSNPKTTNDRRGEVFDPAIHCVDENGNPARNKNGSFRKRPLQKPKEIPTPPPPPPPPVDFNDPAPVSTVQMVCMCLDVTCVIMCSTIGPEMAPTPEERQILTDVWSRFVHYKNWDTALSPEVAVCMVTFMYLSPRIPFITKKWKDKKNAHSSNRSAGARQNNDHQNNSPASGSNGEASGNLGPAK